MAASDSAAAGSAAKTEGTDSSASSAPARDPLEASVGTIVSIITPGERFVVDKLAGQLAVPLQVGPDRQPPTDWQQRVVRASKVLRGWLGSM